MTQERIKEVIALHEDWLNGKIGGERANLSGANLSGADLGEANLSGAFLRGADLRRAFLRGANLRKADLREANLSGADLSGADLSGVRLEDIKGDGKYIKSLQIGKYPISYTAQFYKLAVKIILFLNG